MGDGVGGGVRVSVSVEVGGGETVRLKVTEAESSSVNDLVGENE